MKATEGNRTGATGEGVRAWLATPSGSSALAAIMVEGDAARAHAALGVQSLEIGDLRLVSLFGVDEGVVARVGERRLLITPHGGRGVVRALLECLSDAGVSIERASEIDPLSAYPEGADVFEALALDAIARAPSPLAIPLLSEQPKRWRDFVELIGRGPVEGARLDDMRWRSAALRPLLEPALVAAVGRANVGKSTLLNALARRSVSVVDERPGATRDHVGATLDLGGLVVRWIDTPGLRGAGEATAEERAGLELARSVIERSDLVVVCGDARTGFPDEAEMAVAASWRLLVATRSDLGVATAPDGAPAIEVSVPGGDASATGLDALSEAIRDRLLPREALESPEAWLFDERLIDAVGGAGGIGVEGASRGT